MNKLKQEKGSITVFVLISMLFFVLFLAGMYMLNARKRANYGCRDCKNKRSI